MKQFSTVLVVTVPLIAFTASAQVTPDDNLSRPSPGVEQGPASPSQIVPSVPRPPTTAQDKAPPMAGHNVPPLANPNAAPSQAPPMANPRAPAMGQAGPMGQGVQSGSPTKDQCERILWRAQEVPALRQTSSYRSCNDRFPNLTTGGSVSGAPLAPAKNQ